MVEMLCSGTENNDDDDDDGDGGMSGFKSSSSQPYAIRSLTLPGLNKGNQDRAQTEVQRPFWWEVLCLMKSLPGEFITEVIALLGKMELKTFKDLINFKPTYAQVATILQFLEATYPHFSLEPLAIRDTSEFRDVYVDNTTADTPPLAREEKGEEEEHEEDRFRMSPPYEEPHEIEPRKDKAPHSPEGIDDNPEGMDVFMRLLQRKRDHVPEPPTSHLKTLEEKQNGSLPRIENAKEMIEMYLKKYPRNCRVACAASNILKRGYELLSDDLDRQECIVGGHLSLLLTLMNVDIKSCLLQVSCLDAFYSLLGGSGMDESLPVPTTDRRAVLVNEMTRGVIVTTLVSLATAPDHGGLKSILDSMRCIINYYNRSMTLNVKTNCTVSIRNGIWILHFFLRDGELREKMSTWELPELMELVTNKFPNFPTKLDLVVSIGHFLPNRIPLSTLRQDQITPDTIKMLNSEVMFVIKILRRSEEIATKNPLPRLLRLMEKRRRSDDADEDEDDDDDDDSGIFHRPSKIFAKIFFSHHGVYYPCQAMDLNKTNAFNEDAIVILKSLINVGEEETAQVVLQGGLRAMVNCMSTTYPNKKLQNMLLKCFKILSTDKDNLVVMSAENVVSPLRLCKEKHSDTPEMCKMAQDLIDLCEIEEASPQSALHQSILGIIFYGILQTILNAIEASRRERDLISLPKFSAIIKFLSSGTGGAVSIADKNQWWDHVEVSTNSSTKNNLLDGDQTTYWESLGRTGSHRIEVFMKKGVIVRKMCIEVKSSDINYMPQRITVQASPAAGGDLEEIKTAIIPSSFSGHFEILSNLKTFYSFFNIKIRRCQNGGIDARVYNITCQAAQSSLWPIFGDLFLTRSKLFYRIQVETWLKNPNLGPLELFDMLSAVVLHEQTFSDHFLVTAPARQCIGQACRSAIITPLINHLTDESSGPNLGKLIHKYIHNMDPPYSEWSNLVLSDLSDPQSDPFCSTSYSYDSSILCGNKCSPEYRKAQDCLIEMSRIRRVCRLLVDCDDTSTPISTSSSSQKEMKAADKIIIDDDDDEYIDKGPQILQDPPGSGTTALARCWKEIVCSEVTRMLDEFDSKPPHLLCAKILEMYNKLRQAMLELFGGHSQFALALKEGFAKAFQGLDEVRGVRVCEQISLCINSMMDSVNKDRRNYFCNLGEHQREMLTMQLAEPLQFLHNLDLAHIFEHYYRRHLSNRLLCGHSISLLMEKRLALALAHCFPHKYPLQILQDLEESQKFIDRFLDNELLESLDQAMVHASNQTNLSAEALSLAQKCSYYRQRYFHVYVLNPSFWPLRHRFLPVQSLPPPLSVFCEDYVHFFTRCHEYGLRQHERPRKLYFTLYGWASLSYGELRLHTSTIQMIILLHFNKKKVHSLKSLQEVTQLSFSDLKQALVGLTTQGCGILFADYAEEKRRKKSRMSPEGVAYQYGLGQADGGSIPVRPFRPSTLFKLNENFTSSENEATSSFHFQKVNNRATITTTNTSTSFSPPPPHEELKHIFERRRAILDAAIIRMLKSEREKDLSDLSAMVIQGCSEGRFGQRPPFGRFDCDYRDVCSRVDYLISNEYIRRKETNQQKLVYVPDRTITSVKTPIQETARKFGSGKFNFSRLTSGSTISKSKRKRRTIRPFVPSRNEDAPLLSMLPSSRTLSIHQVEVQMKSLVDTLSEVVHLDSDLTECMLSKCGWRKDKFFKRFLENSSSLLFDSGLGPEGATKPSTSPPKSRTGRGKVSCPVCLLLKPNHECLSLWCGHLCCQSCWESHVKSRMEMNQMRSLSCTVQGCHAIVTRSFVVKLFGGNSEPVQKFTTALVREYVQMSGRLSWCCNPQGCGEVLVKGDGMNTDMCQKCQWTTCFTCNFLEAHEPASCENMQKWSDLGGFVIAMNSDAKSKQLTKLIAKQCPSCHTQIEKNEGCMHMKCKCGHDFCWRCLKPWKPTHTDYFNCTTKVSQAAKDHKKFADYNSRCAILYKSKAFAEKLCLLVKAIDERVSIKTLSFLSDACQLLVQSHKMLGYACVAEYFSARNSTLYLEFLSDSFECDTNALQAFLENSLLSQPDLAHAIRQLPERQIMDGYRLVSKIENTREKLLIGYHHHFKVGQVSFYRKMEEEKYGNFEPSDYDSEDGDDDEGDGKGKRYVKDTEDGDGSHGNEEELDGATNEAEGGDIGEEEEEYFDPEDDPEENVGAQPTSLMSALWSFASRK